MTLVCISLVPKGDHRVALLFCTRYGVCRLLRCGVLERFRSLFGGFEHSKLYVDWDWVGIGYLQGAILRAPDGANNCVL